MMNDNYTITEDFKLPSLGKIYGQEFDPHIRLRSMTVREEMKRQSQTAFPNKLLCEIIDSCLITKLPISSYDMCLGDYEYLLHKLRIVTYGADYKMTVGCPHENCRSIHDEIINLDDLKTIEYDADTYNKLSSFTLPVSKKLITIDIQTPRMVDAIKTKVDDFKRKNPNINIDNTPLITLQEVINTVDGLKLNYAELYTFIENLSARDYNYIMNKIEKLNSSIGVDTQISITCKKCGGEIRSFFRAGNEFFRPSIDE